MTYQVIIPKPVKKMLDVLPNSVESRVYKHLEILEKNPRPIGFTKLRGRDGWRIRVGDYRILYKILEEEKVVLLTKVGHRKDVYR